MPRFRIGAVAALGALAVLALAHQAGPSRAQAEGSAPRFIERPSPGTMRASAVIGLPVIGMDHVRVGTISDVLVDGSGRAQTVVIGVGGFLGIGEKDVALPFDQVAWNVGDVPLTDGPSSVATVRSAPGGAATGPESMPGAQTNREVLADGQDRPSDRVSAATGPVEPQRPSGKPATVLAGDRPIHAEIRLTKAQIKDAPAFRFERSGP